jgi:hypothetical protein
LSTWTPATWRVFKNVAIAKCGIVAFPGDQVARFGDVDRSREYHLLRSPAAWRASVEHWAARLSAWETDETVTMSGTLTGAGEKQILRGERYYGANATFAATWFLAVFAALKLDGVALEEI